MSRGRAKKGMFEGDLKEGELEIGQVSAMIKEIMTVDDIMIQMLEDFENARKKSYDFS